MNIPEASAKKRQACTHTHLPAIPSTGKCFNNSECDFIAFSTELVYSAGYGSFLEKSQINIDQSQNIENMTRFDNSSGNNNCWLNCVIRVIATMLSSLPEDYNLDYSSQNPFINSFLIYLK